MAFWSSQTLEARIAELIEPPNKDAVDCNAITLRVGREIYITPELEDAHTQTKQQLRNHQGFLIPPGQFAYLVTEEVVKVPKNAMAFISMKATFKMKGLVNVSGFHADPGWEGPIIFAVFNAGPSPIHLHQGLPLFLIWYADLDDTSTKSKVIPGPSHIPPETINNLTGGVNLIHALEKRVTDEIERRREEDDKLNNRIHDLEKSQTRLLVTAGVLLTIAVSLATYVFFRSPISIGVPAPSTPTQHSSAILRPSPNVASATTCPVVRWRFNGPVRSEPIVAPQWLA
jgi:dCTP deaminase